MLGFIVTLIIVGLLAGAVARLVVPGRQPMSILATIVLGIVGSFVGGFLGYLLFHKDASQGALQPAGIIGSIIGAILVLLIWTRVGSRSAAIRNSLLPSGPVIGLSVIPSTAQPGSAAHQSLIRAHTAPRTAGSRTTPLAPTAD